MKKEMWYYGVCFGTRYDAADEACKACNARGNCYTQTCSYELNADTEIINSPVCAPDEVLEFAKSRVAKRKKRKEAKSFIQRLKEQTKKMYPESS